MPLTRMDTRHQTQHRTELLCVNWLLEIPTQILSI